MRGSCKGFPSACGNALVQACTDGHEKIVDLLLEPRYGIKKKGSQYEQAVLNAARGRPDEGYGHIRILQSLLTKGEFPNLQKLRRNILGEACYWGREDVVRLMLQHLTSVRFCWRGQKPLNIALSRKHESIVQLLLAHDADPGKQCRISVGGLRTA
jgi:hypothetical protein